MLTARDFFVYGMKLSGLYQIIVGVVKFIALLPSIHGTPSGMGLSLPEIIRILALLIVQVGFGLYLFLGGKFVVAMALKEKDHYVERLDS